MKKSKKIFIAVILLGILLFLYALYDCLIFEFNHAYNSDSPLYWAVGRGIMNGLVPYSEMYENKPLGIFLLSYVNFLFTDDIFMCNIFSLIAIISIAFLPLLIFRELLKNEKINYINYSIVFLLIFISSIFFMTYSENNSGAFQVEAFGASCSLLYIWSVIFLKNANNKKQIIIRTIISFICIQLVVLMKEPFLLIALGSSILFIDKIKDFIKCMVIPSFIGGFCYLFMLFIFKVIKPYFSIYLFQMFSTRFGGESSALSRTMNIWYLLVHLSKFNKVLTIILIIFLFFSFLGVIYYSKLSNKLFHLFRLILLVIITSFCVGMGGQYYDHHFIFAVPSYLSLIIYGSLVLYKQFDEDFFLKKIFIVFILFLIPILIINSNREYYGNYSKVYSSIKKNAIYVDKLLDFYNEDTYQFIGFNGEEAFYGLTKHSPKGPVFAQDKDNFLTDNNWFAISFLRQLQEVNIIIFDQCYTSSVRKELNDILDNDFTIIPPMKFESRPDDFDYIVFYRKNYFKNA